MDIFIHQIDSTIHQTHCLSLFLLFFSHPSINFISPLSLSSISSGRLSLSRLLCSRAVITSSLSLSLFPSLVDRTNTHRQSFPSTNLSHTNEHSPRHSIDSNVPTTFDSVFTSTVYITLDHHIQPPSLHTHTHDSTSTHNLFFQPTNQPPHRPTRRPCSHHPPVTCSPPSLSSSSPPSPRQPPPTPSPTLHPSTPAHPPSSSPDSSLPADTLPTRHGPPRPPSPLGSTCTKGSPCEKGRNRPMVIHRMGRVASSPFSPRGVLTRVTRTLRMEDSRFTLMDLIEGEWSPRAKGRGKGI